MSATGPAHLRRRAWTPGGYAMHTLQRLAGAAGGAAVHELELLAACNDASTGPGRRRRMPQYRRDIIANLQERGYIEPGEQPRTWHLCAGARAELERIAAGLAARAYLHADDARADAEAAEALPAQIAPRRQMLAELVRPDLRDALTRGIVRAPMSAADRAPCTERAGAAQARACPSRRGDRLYWRDGSITTLDGDRIAQPS